MIVNPYSSTGYNPWYQQAQPAAQTQNNGIIWVQGEAGAKSFQLQPGQQSALLMDSEDNVFYIKSCDVSGMPLPLRTFDYTERVVAKNATAIPGDYVTREEFEKRLSEIADAKQPVPAAERKPKSKQSE